MHALHLFLNYSQTTKELVVKYEEQRRHFMTSTTVNQFRKLFPASATPTELSSGKIPLVLKLRNKWGDSTISDLTDLVCLLGVPGDHLHLSKIDKGCIAVLWLISITNAEKLNPAIFDAANLLQSKGVFRVLVEGKLVLECSQHYQGIILLQVVIHYSCKYYCLCCLLSLLHRSDFLSDKFLSKG